jgi:hypothetical protein
MNTCRNCGGTNLRRIFDARKASVEQHIPQATEPLRLKVTAAASTAREDRAR